MSKVKITVSALLLIITFFVLSPTSAHASFFDDFVNGVKSTVSNGINGVKDLFSKKEFTVDSNISLAPGGDVDKDGVIDSGDIVRFDYVITNTTDKKYTFGTLKTNVNRKELSFIHNVQGVTGLIDNNNTITFPNLWIEPSQKLEISFDARVNYDQNNDQTISTEPEFIDHDKKSVVKSALKEVKAKKISPEKLKSILRNINTDH